MVYHLLNEISLEMAKTEPNLMAGIVSDLLKEHGIIYDPSKVRPKIEEALRQCNKSDTLKGFEACLVINSEDIDPVFSGGGFKGAREEIFKTIDEAAKTFDFYYRDHKLG